MKTLKAEQEAAAAIDTTASSTQDTMVQKCSHPPIISSLPIEARMTKLASCFQSAYATFCCPNLSKWRTVSSQ